MPLVINSLGADTHTNTRTDVCTETILRNQACTWFKKRMQCNCTTKTYSTLYLHYSAYYTCNYYTKLQMLLHKITDCVRNNNTKLQIK